MITPSSLHPSNAGIGSKLKNAKAREINPQNIRNCIRPPLCMINSHTRAAPTGHERLLRADDLSEDFDDTAFFMTHQRAGKVSFA
jgi:hypothetical protein